jgi:hypothetical protein
LAQTTLKKVVLDKIKKNLIEHLHLTLAAIEINKIRF